MAESGPGTLVLRTGSPEETRALGETLGRVLRARAARGAVVALTGPLGAGKTTFVRGLARGAGSDAHVASPTFQLVRVYPGRVQIAHVDLYRVKVAGELADLGLDELLEVGAVVVEWGDRLDARHGRLISFEPVEGDRRRLRFEPE